MVELNNNDFGILLEIIGFLFAFGTFRVSFYLIYELIRREIVFYTTMKSYKKTEEYKIRRSQLKTLGDMWRFNREFANEFSKEYHEKHWKHLANKGEERWPGLKNILKFIGWFLITIGLIYQFSIFQQTDSGL
ncbi:MAG: hypothetical protein WAO91_01555 [Candidatus Nitrosotenuis sp.]